MFERLLIFLFKVVASACVILLIIVCTCSGLLLKFLSWKSAREQQQQSSIKRVRRQFVWREDEMEEPFEILIVGFCGVILTFALIFVACWCLISCSFFCLRYIYCANLNKLVSALSLASSVSVTSDDSEDDDDCSSIQSMVMVNPAARLALGEGIEETGSSSIPTGKTECPPLYDFPPPYHSLFPKGEEVVVIVNEEIPVPSISSPNNLQINNSSGSGTPV